MKYKQFSWDDMDRAFRILSTKILMNIETSEVPIKCVVGISRGGLIPATFLSHYLEVPLVVVDYSSKNGNGDDKNHSNAIPALPIERGDTILLVDDLLDTGNTMKELKAHFESEYNQGANVKTCVIIDKQTNVIITPTFYWAWLETSDWIEFPWEREAQSANWWDSAKDFLLHGKKSLAPSFVSTARLKICEKCVALHKHSCTICGCDVRRKTKMVKLECPMRKW